MKNLEIEYNNMINAELPDLWSRIEAGVDDYEASRKNNVEAIKSIETKQNKTEKRLTKNTIMTIGKIVAAAAAVLIVANTFRMFGNRDMSNATADSCEEAATCCEEDTYSFQATDAAEEACEASASTDTVNSDKATADTREKSAQRAEEVCEAEVEEETDETVMIDAAPMDGFIEMAQEIWNCDNYYTEDIYQSLIALGAVNIVEYEKLMYSDVAGTDLDVIDSSEDLENVSVTILTDEEGSKYCVYALETEYFSVLEINKFTE